MKCLLCSVCVLISFIGSLTALRNENNYTCGPLYITISARGKVVLNWHFTCDNPPDTLLLLLSDSRSYEQIHDSIHVGNEREGHHSTGYAFPQNPIFPGNWNEGDEKPDLDSHCLPLVVESLRNGNLVDRRCFEIHPTWMARFGKLRLGSMMVPGTHNSGSYKGLPILLKNYALCQDRDWWQQLVFGIRFFDVRVGVYDDDQVYLVHNFARLTPLEPELDRIAEFLKKSPTEIVILDFHAFKNPVHFSRKNHRVVLELLKRKLGSFIYPKRDMYYDEGPTINQLWSDVGRVIISYNSREIVNENSWLWPEINRDWGNIISVDKLQQYVVEKSGRKQYGNPMSVLMAELTPTNTYVLFHPMGSVKNLADDVNPHLGPWLRKNDRSDNINIIATDFFLGNNMIQLAIETNHRKLRRLS